MSKLKSLAYPHLQRLRYASLVKKFDKSKRLPMKDNAVLMLSTSKGRLGGNLLAVREYLEKNKLPFDVSVVTSENMPGESVLAELLATSRFIMVDDFEPMVYPLTLRENQHLIQVWHAMGAYKKFGYMRESAEKNSLTHKNYTEAICSSPELVSIYAESFGISEEKIKPVGTPRTDLFFNEEYVNSAKERLYTAYPELRNKKIALFAPTFRGNSVNDGYYPEEWFNAEELAKELGDGWAVIVKLHPFIKNREGFVNMGSKCVFDLSDEREINDILFITDVLITDYSSVIYENAIIGNAAVLYTPDFDDYCSGRGFCFDFKEYVCGDIVTKKAELANAVKAARADDERMAAFKKRFVSLCDGNSTKRFVEAILEDKNV